MNEHHAQLLKDNNLSVTAPRLAILWALDKHPHADAETILNLAQKKIDSLSKQAVYDNLHALTEHGILRMIQPMGHAARYETRICDNHHHIVCRDCGLTADVDCTHGKAPCLKPSEQHGFILDEAEVIFWGLCPKCQNSKSNKEKRK